ncbi:MAG: bifunctional diaminohydroxyphosphoribosylaminopyrimidine deaminase/5-amino-6-(5-phosphoribosylamino)uracil reductase RibD [Synergistaceae bacterium]|jgi:diaminohydroxyphosphoribosylaminopyrimidine deaminase/5-amino-6-(5-phosphoribosylamino)uracil reductase|nr:bifunctional diaminohydroxyphosphoribosylaminopyrimidine deaminase/5-amino-6-(5-phosphoribosylamino)uracil reductase RibD [Synergistaceae bacterium]
MTRTLLIDEYYMHRALSLAWRGRTSPNPRVGCVIVKDGTVVGEGWHKARGCPHAEVEAIGNAPEDDLRGATAYVTLEPCSHYGLTPPCAPRLAEAGIRRVVAGCLDPDPRVSGRGVKILQDAGVEVSIPCLEAECRWINRGFIKSQTLGRPWVTLKAAAGLDGKLALPNGASKWITGASARTAAQLMRAEHDAVLVGAGTVLADNPKLTVRDAPGESPIRVVLDAHNSIPPDAAVRPCLIMGGELTSVLSDLNDRGIRSVLVEGGAKVLSSFIEAKLCDSLALFRAASVMGSGPSFADGVVIDSMGSAVRLRNTRCRRIGEDFLIEGTFDWCSQD